MATTGTATKALHSATPETATNSVLAYTFAVQHGTLNFSSSSADFLPSSTSGVSTNVSDFFVLARLAVFTPTQSRTITRVYELNNFVGGRAVELIPGGISDDNIAITRVELYQQTILEAFDPHGIANIDSNGNPATFGRGGIDNLVYQKTPFLLLRYLFFPQLMIQGFGDDGSNARVDLYGNCFFERISKTVDMTGGAGGLVNAEATIQVTKRRSRFLNLPDSELLASSLLNGQPGTFGMPTANTGAPQYQNNIGVYDSQTSGGVGGGGVSRGGTAAGGAGAFATSTT